MLLVVALMIGCGPTPEPPKPPSGHSCARSCANVERMNCKALIEMGCEAWCTNSIAGGRRVALECLADAVTCDEAEQCRP